MPDRDSALQLAGRLSSKPLPRTATALAVSAGLITATLLILVAGNRPMPDPVVTGKPAAHQTSQAVPAIGNTDGAAALAMRGGVDLAASRLRGTELH